MANNIPDQQHPADDSEEIRRLEVAEDLAAIRADWGVVWSDFDQIRGDADFEL